MNKNAAKLMLFASIYTLFLLNAVARAESDETLLNEGTHSGTLYGYFGQVCFHDNVLFDNIDRELWENARAAYENGNWEQAISKFEQLSTRSGDKLCAWDGSGEIISHATESLMKSAECFREIDGKDPSAGTPDAMMARIVKYATSTPRVNAELVDRLSDLLSCELRFNTLLHPTMIDRVYRFNKRHQYLTDNLLHWLWRDGEWLVDWAAATKDQSERSRKLYPGAVIFQVPLKNPTSKVFVLLGFSRRGNRWVWDRLYMESPALECLRTAEAKRPTYCRSLLENESLPEFVGGQKR